MSELPVASVVIPVLNGEASLADLLAALKGQVGVPGRFEIIVADNGSSDRTVELACAAGATVVHQPVRGPAAARNAGILAAQGRVIAHTDCDTRPNRRWLASLVKAVDVPGVVIATGPIVGWPLQTAAERFTEANGHYSKEVSFEHPVFPYATGMNLAVKREALLAVGLWDASMASGEDIDLCIRLRARLGARIEWVGGAGLLHRHRQNDEDLWKQARWYGQGLAQLHQRHPALIPWGVWRTIATRAQVWWLGAMAPVNWSARLLRLTSAERAEFERYYRLWRRHYWCGFFERYSRSEA